MELRDKVAIVTGASQGIGRAISIALAKEGASVVLASRNEAKLEETAQIIKSNGGTSLKIRTDVSKEAEVKNMVQKTLETFGTIDILVNNSGIAGPTARCEDVTLEEWEETMAVNLRGPFLCCKYVIPTLKAKKSGRIIHIGSISSKRPLQNRTPYTTSKMGLIGFNRTLAVELGPFNITVNLICPGATAGERLDNVMTTMGKALGKSYEEMAATFKALSPLNRFVNAEDIASMVVYLASDKAKNITGQDINVCAGIIMY
ncbi:MAG TPA: SDR family NAD(P)-dependent oxidoreductase [Candidatus Limnocylindrales bacterium]|nr:SDR family NAD(P)-dependent oxidoreductase [Candidatus Limnocylindrales bacterium]